MGTTITNPVINGPYEYDVPARHFRFNDDGITDQIVDGRRRSEYFVPVPQTKKRGAQLQFDNKWTINRITPNSRPFPHPETNGKIAVKVINHYGDELLTVLDLPDPGTTS